MSTNDKFHLKSTPRGSAICAVHDGSLETYMVIEDHGDAKRYLNLLNQADVNHVKI